MKLDIFKDILLFIVISFVQIVLLSHIRLFGYATPMLQVYFILMFNRNYPRWGLLLWGFTIGLLLDTFANTPGMYAASMTLIAMLQPSVLELFMSRDNDIELKPSTQTMGWGKYLTYAAILTSVFCIVFFSIETFSFFNWGNWLLSIAGSFVFTMIVIIVLQIVQQD